MTNDEKLITFNCSNQMHQELIAEAKRLDRSKAWVMRKAFEEYKLKRGTLNENRTAPV